MNPSDITLIKTRDRSSMESIQLATYENGNLTITIKNDSSHGHRVFTLTEQDAHQLQEALNNLI